MSPQPNNSVSFDPSLLEQLACPACLSALSVEKENLACANCGRTYPLVDGIPVLIADRNQVPER